MALTTQAQNSTLNFGGPTGQPNSSAFTPANGAPFFTGGSAQGQNVTPSPSQFTPLTNQYQGQNPSFPAGNALGVSPGYLGSIAQNPTQNLQNVGTPTFQWEAQNLNQFLPLIQGNTAASQGAVGANSGTVWGSILGQFEPGMNAQALNQVSQANAFQQALAQAVAGASMQRNPYAGPQGPGQNNAPGVSISGTPNFPPSNLPPSNGTQFAPPSGQPQALPPQTPPPTQPANTQSAASNTQSVSNPGGTTNTGVDPTTGFTQSGTYTDPSGQTSNPGNLPGLGPSPVAPPLVAGGTTNTGVDPTTGFTQSGTYTDPSGQTWATGWVDTSMPGLYLQMPAWDPTTGQVSPGGFTPNPIGFSQTAGQTLGPFNSITGTANDPSNFFYNTRPTGGGGLNLSDLSTGFAASQPPSVPTPMPVNNGFSAISGGGFSLPGPSVSDFFNTAPSADTSGPAYLPSGVNVSSLPGYGNNPVVSVGGNPMDSTPSWWSANLT